MEKKLILVLHDGSQWDYFIEHDGPVYEVALELKDALEKGMIMQVPSKSGLPFDTVEWSAKDIKNIIVPLED